MKIKEVINEADDEQIILRMLNSQPAEKLLKTYKKLYKREYPGTSKSELVAKIKSKVRNYKQAYELINEKYKHGDYARGGKPMPKAKKGRTQHPLHGKLVGG